MLNDIKVLDFSRLLPGPYASLLLADMGAEIIKVEDTNKGDYMRDFPPAYQGLGTFYLAANRSKKSLAIDYRSTEGKEIIYELVKKCDVVLESFRPGAMKAFGLDYETLREINPGLIYCSLTGYGQKGPLKANAGHDANYLSLAGALEIIAHSNERPVIPGVQIADLSGGMYAAMAIVTALYSRNFSGKGKYLDISMLDGIMSWASIMNSQEYMAGEEVLAGKHLFAEGVVCYNIYETKDNRYMALGSLEEKFWEDFCIKIERTDLIPRQFDKAEEGNATYQEVVKIFASKDLAEWVELFKDADVCLTPVLKFSEVLESPYARETGMIFNVSNSTGEIKQVHSPISKNFYEGEFTYPPAHGEHSKEVLLKFGITQERYNQLAKNKTIAQK